jgi:TolB protein
MIRAGIATALLVAAAPAHAAPAGSTLLVSRPDGFGAVPPAFDNSSDGPLALSPDGRYALFRSQADGFAPGADPFSRNAFVRDTLTGSTALVDRSDGPGGAGGDSDVGEADLTVANIGGQPHVLVVFSTRATNLTDHPTGSVIGSPGRDQVWLRDVTAGETTLVSRADTATGAAANQNSGKPAIAVANSGPVVVFQSTATNLGATGSGGVYLRRLGVSDTELVSCKNANCATPAVASAADPDVATFPGTPGHPNCPSPAHSECIFVAFDTADTTMTGDGAGNRQVMMAIVDPGVTATAFKLISLPDQALAPAGNASSSAPSFSGDGQAVAFLSNATNLTLDTMTPGLPQQALVRIPGGAISSDSRTFLLSKAASPADAAVFTVALGGTAAQPRAVFATQATNLGGISRQAYLRDHAAGTTTLLNRAPGPGGAAGDSFADTDVAISGNGSAASFASSSRNLGDGDLGQFTRIRVRRLDTPGQEVELVSRPDGFQPFKALTHTTLGLATSADGRFVAFASDSPSLSADDQDGDFNVFVRDTLTGSTTLVSRADGAGGAPARAAFLNGISGDGRKVVFNADNLTSDSPANITETYVRDLDAGTTTLVSRANGPTGAPSPTVTGQGVLSGDGRSVAFVSDAALDPAGGGGVSHVYLRDLVAQTTTLVDRDDGRPGAVADVNSEAPVLNGDGTRLAFATSAPFAGAPNDGRFHVYVRDLRTGTTTLASRAEGAGASADQDARFPSLNRAGDVVAFVSRAQNLGATFVNDQIFVRDVTGGHTQLVSRASGGGMISASAGHPVLDAAGTRVSFFAAGDLDLSVSPPPPFGNQVYVRDLPTDTVILVSRADGAGAAPADGRSTALSAITASGDCVAFQSSSTNLGDGFASADFGAVHLRVLRNECPTPAAVTPPPAGPAPVPPAVRVKPAVLSRLAISPRSFRVTGAKRGAKITFRLDKAGPVTLTFDRLLAGRRKGKRCLTTLKKGRRCTAVRRVGRLSVKGRKGTTTVKFSGVLARKRLAVGRYRLLAQPRGGKTRTVGFQVLRPATRRK